MTTSRSNMKHKPQVGDIRPSQLLLSFGVGATIELPHLSALIMGLDDWNTRTAVEIVEPRLLQAIQSVLGNQMRRLLSPPIDEENGNPYAHNKPGVPVSVFPRWMVCPKCRLLASVDSAHFELKTNLNHPDRTCYRHQNCNKGNNPIAVPSRFIIACEGGHLDDFPWHHFVHGDRPCNAALYMEEIGVSGEPSDIRIVCRTCNQNQPMNLAFSTSEEEGRSYKPKCTGRSPHLRSFAKTCQYGKARTTLLSASNTWFPLVYTSLSIPEGEDILGQKIEEHWGILQGASAIDVLRNFMLIPHIGSAFADYAIEAVWQAIEHKIASTTEVVRPGDLKLPEWLNLSNPLNAPRTDDFEATPTATPEGYENAIQQVVLVERMREVRALTGFTRIESLSDYAEDEELPKDHIMKLSNRAPEWIPATEVRGEGIFIQFREEAIQEWLKRTAVQHHNDLFRHAHRRWREAHHMENPEANYPDMRYILLHTFAHALMRQLTLECGYSAASIRERIYAQPPQSEGGAMAGVLLYTAASDSEGTLGGLVNQGNQLGFHIGGAKDDMEYCTSDPLCAEHISFEDNTLHGAACHACLFAPETSCERGNKYLDRSVLVRTVERDDLAFFQ